MQRDPGELVVAGVYVRLLVQNPGWSLRRPVEFLSEGLNALCALLAREPHQVGLRRHKCGAGGIAILLTTPKNE